MLLILHRVETDTYHPAVFLEAPMPGPVPAPEDVEVVRLRSKMHHTTGAPTLEEAQALFDELAASIMLPDTNLWRDEAVAWDGELGLTLVYPNWLRGQKAV